MKYEFHDYLITVPPGTSLLAPVDNKEVNQLIVLKANEVIGTFEWREKEGLVVNGQKIHMRFEEEKKIVILP